MHVSSALYLLDIVKTMQVSMTLRHLVILLKSLALFHRSYVCIYYIESLIANFSYYHAIAYTMFQLVYVSSSLIIESMIV